MKSLILIAAVFAGSYASAVTCADYRGNTASLTFYNNGMSISSAYYGDSGFLRANGKSGSSYYFRGGYNTTAIVNKSIVNGGGGTMYYINNSRRSDGGFRIRFYCN
jgi:hypothetical protein